MPPPFRRFVQGFAYAGQGMAHLLRTQRNAQVHALLTIVALGLAASVGLRASEWAVLSLTIGLVWAAEAFNTALEATIDLISPTPHPLAKIAKDTAAAGVLCSALAAAAVAAFLFLPHF
ncbi:MAG: diacylglycerol kinase family protein [Caldilineales bacterium]|nr:diacylglycerol kinase family protein [Caldilineales bacterium]